MARVFPPFAFFCVFLSFASVSSGQSAKPVDNVIYATFPGQPAPTKEMLATLLRQIRWDTRLAGDQNPEGLRLRFERIATQGAATEPAQYRVFAEGAPENKVYNVGVWLIGKTLLYRRQNIYVNGQGLLLQQRPTVEQESSFTVPGEELILTPEAGNAEPVRYLLSSVDDQLSIMGTLVPHPVFGQDQECRLEARMAEPDASAILIAADGFPADTRLSLVLESEGKNAHLNLTTDESGHAEVADFPTVPGKTQGSLLITAEGTDCLPAVRLPWGAAPVAKAP
jgi:hypothetical protein